MITNSKQRVEQLLKLGARLTESILAMRQELDTALGALSTPLVVDAQEYYALNVNYSYQRHIPAADDPRLSPREALVCTLAHKGMKYRLIASEMGITIGTVKIHMLHARIKVGLKGVEEEVENDQN